MALDFTKNPADKHVGVFLGPSGGATVGVTNVYAPLAAELNNTGGTSLMVNASKSISWNDYDFGTQASDTNNEPSLADAATFTEFGKANYGGGMSFYYPEDYDDNSNVHSLVYDLTDIPGTINDIAVRIDGDIDALAPAADGQFVSVYRAQGEAEANPFTPGESKRRTVTYLQKSDFAPFIPVGTQTITTIPATTATVTVADKSRFRASIQGRDVTNMLSWSTSNGAVINVFSGGYYVVTGAGTATVTATHPDGTTTKTIAVTAS